MQDANKMKEIYETTKSLIISTLQLKDNYNIDINTQLLGNIPELDSMSVVSIITALEDYYGFIADDDEISADTFESVGSLVKFVQEKISQQ